MGRKQPKFHGFIGKKKTIQSIERYIEGAKRCAETFPHGQILGPSGSGKTLLARGISKELGTRLIISNGRDSCEEQERKLSLAKRGDVFFIDEAHGLDQTSQELLYQVIDGTREEKSDDSKGSNDGSPEAKPPVAITIILATDQPGRLRDALRKRMHIEIMLDAYTIEEMREIISSMATERGILISPQAVTRIANLSAGLPRRAMQILDNCRLFFSKKADEPLTASDIEEYCEYAELTEDGLKRYHCKYLKYLAGKRQSSLASLARHIGIDNTYLTQEIEPDLLRADLITIEPRGRMLSDAGRQYVETKLTTIEEK